MQVEPSAFASGHLVYGNTFLPVWNPEIATWVRRQIPLDDYVPFDTGRWYSHDLGHLNLPGPYDVGKPEIGVVRWPQGASHWAVGNFVVDGATLDQLRDEIGPTNRPLPLVLGTSSTSGYSYDPFNRTAPGAGIVSSYFHMLPPRRLLVGTQPPPRTPQASAEYELLMAMTEELWVITLVDERYYWWQRPVSLSAASGSASGGMLSSWSDLFAAIGEGMGLTVEHPEVPSAYLGPTDRYNVHNVPGPLLLDSAAEAVGMRLVRGLNGVIRLQQWQEALDAHRAWHVQATTPAPDTGPYAGWGRVQGGGRMASADIARSVPEGVLVVFGRRQSSGGAFLDEQFSQYRYLDGYTLSGGYGDLTLSADYGASARGMPGNLGRFTADAFVTEATGSQADASALANQAAYDWYGWQLGEVDIELPGIVPWELDAMAAQVRWTFEEDRVSTRVVRSRYFDTNVYGHYPAPGGGTVDLIAVCLTGKDHTTPFIRYSGFEVQAVGSLVYSRKPGGREFTVAGTPLYHEQNTDLPVYLGVTAVPGEAVVWVRPWSGPGEYWMIEHDPRWEFVEIDPTQSTVSGSDGFAYARGFLLRYNQDNRSFRRYQSVLIRRAQQVPIA